MIMYVTYERIHDYYIIPSILLFQATIEKYVNMSIKYFLYVRVLIN